MLYAQIIHLCRLGVLSFVLHIILSLHIHNMFVCMNTEVAGNRD